jgi:hypothetical protein
MSDKLTPFAALFFFFFFFSRFIALGFGFSVVAKDSVDLAFSS